MCLIFIRLIFFYVLYFSPLFLTYAFVFCAFATVCSVTVASLYYQTWSWLMIVFLYPLVFQAGRSDKKASQGHEEKHRGWFRCVNCRVCHWSLLVHQHSWCCLAGLSRTRKTFGCPVFCFFFVVVRQLSKQLDSLKSFLDDCRLHVFWDLCSFRAQFVFRFCRHLFMCFFGYRGHVYSTFYLLICWFWSCVFWKLQ